MIRLPKQEIMNVSGRRTLLCAFSGVLLAGLATLTLAAAQPLPPPPTSTAPTTTLAAPTPNATAPNSAAPTAVAPKPKPKPKPKIAKPKPQTKTPLSLTSPAAPPRPPADVSNSPPPAQPATPLLAQPSSPRPGQLALNPKQVMVVERVSNYLSNLRTLVGEFKQVAPDGSRTEGDFYLAKPGRIRFDYNPPSPLELIADGRSVAVRDRNLASQDVFPISQTPLRFLLADRIDLLKDTNIIAVYGDNVFATVVIEERQIVRGTYRLMLMFDAQTIQLKQWVVTDPQGMDTTVVVYNLDPNTKPDPDLFKIDYTRYVK
jgi:outer membrane lipoprotein-sorting protein